MYIRIYITRLLKLDPSQLLARRATLLPPTPHTLNPQHQTLYPLPPLISYLPTGESDSRPPSIARFTNPRQHAGSQQPCCNPQQETHALTVPNIPSPPLPLRRWM